MFIQCVHKILNKIIPKINQNYEICKIRGHNQDSNRTGGKNFLKKSKDNEEAVCYD